MTHGGHGGIHAEEEVMLARQVLAFCAKLASHVERFETAMVGEIRGINHRLGVIMAAIDDLKTAVAAEDDVIDQAIAYIEDLGARLEAALNSDDDADLAALAADVNQHAADLREAQASSPGAGTTGGLPTGTVTGADGAPLDESHTDANTTLPGLDGSTDAEPTVPVSDADTPPSQVVSDAFGAGAIGNPETAPGGDSAPPVTEDNPVLSGTPGENQSVENTDDEHSDTE